MSEGVVHEQKKKKKKKKLPKFEQFRCSKLIVSVLFLLVWSGRDLILHTSMYQSVNTSILSSLRILVTFC